jgi:uncharacterized protein (TIGR01244 family)
LKELGYAAVVNLRNDGEPEQPLSPQAEARVVESTGLEYLHVGVGGQPLGSEGVDRVLDLLDRHADEKVLVHCRSGGRAAALVLIYQAKHNGWSNADAIEKGRLLGLDVKGNLQMMVDQYLNSH